MTIRDIEIFQNTPAWQLAQEVQEENVMAIEKILGKDSSVLNYQEPRFGMTLLMWAVQSEKYNSVKALLALGADPNLKSKTGATALFKAISFSWSEDEYNSNPKYVEMLLNYGADPDIVYIGQNRKGVDDPIEEGTSPLMHAVSRGLEKVKLLVENGANVDYKTKTNKTAAIIALLMGKVDEAHYLIVESNADVSGVYYFYELGGDAIEYNKPHYPIDLLREWIFDLESDEYQKKLEIIKEFQQVGIDYRSTPIHPRTLERIKKRYPEHWEKYLEKY